MVLLVAAGLPWQAAIGLARSLLALQPILATFVLAALQPLAPALHRLAHHFKLLQTRCCSVIEGPKIRYYRALPVCVLRKIRGNSLKRVSYLVIEVEVCVKVIIPIFRHNYAGLIAGLTIPPVVLGYSLPIRENPFLIWFFCRHELK